MFLMKGTADRIRSRCWAVDLAIKVNIMITNCGENGSIYLLLMCFYMSLSNIGVLENIVLYFESLFETCKQ